MEVENIEIEKEVAGGKGKKARKEIKLNRKLPDKSLRAHQPKNWAEFKFPFVYNQIDTELFPLEAWRECSRLALGRNALPIWTSEAIDIDCPDLVLQLRKRMLHYRGISVDEDEILVTVGAQHALSIVSTLFADDKRPIAFENPGYQEARHLFHMSGNNIESVSVDKHGLIPHKLPKKFKLVYLTPSCQFPTMVTMNEDRRKIIMERAQEEDAFIIEDDYEVGLLGHLKPIAAMKSHDTNGNVIYIGSLSKTLSPSIRIGFIVASKEIIDAAKIIRSLTVRHPPSIVQETTALFLAHGYHDHHLKKLRDIYSQRWHIMEKGIKHYLPMFKPGNAKGGTSFWLTGPKKFNANEFAQHLQKFGVLIEPGNIFFLSGTPKNSFRIGFPSVATDKINKGLKIIGEEAKQFLKTI